MGQKETIVDLLKTKGTMTQLVLAEAIYGDKNHGPNIYGALMGLVNSGVVLRTGSQPAYLFIIRCRNRDSGEGNTA